MINLSHYMNIPVLIKILQPVVICSKHLSPKDVDKTSLILNNRPLYYALDDKGIFALTTVSSHNMSRVMRKPTFWFPTWSDTNQAVQLQRMARGLKFQI